MGSGKEGEEMTEFPFGFRLPTKEEYKEYFREQAKKVPHERWREDVIMRMFQKLPLTVIVTVNSHNYVVDKHLSPPLPNWIEPAYMLGDDYGEVWVDLYKKETP
jgi:hypothetical protein